MKTHHLLERFSAQAEAFERAFLDDDWSRLEPYFTVDAVYETLGEGGERFEGRSAALMALRRAVTNFDRRCDSRALVTVSGPFVAPDEVSRDWRCRFAVSGAPDLVIDGHERAVYRGDQIELLQETLTPEARAKLSSWVGVYGSKLAPRRSSD